MTDIYNNRLIHHGSQYNSINAVPRAQEEIQEKIPGSDGDVSIERYV